MGLIGTTTSEVTGADDKLGFIAKILTHVQACLAQIFFLSLLFCSPKSDLSHKILSLLTCC
jgi:hypothetical protein